MQCVHLMCPGQTGRCCTALVRTSRKQRRHWSRMLELMSGVSDTSCLMQHWLQSLPLIIPLASSSTSTASSSLPPRPLKFQSPFLKVPSPHISASTLTQQLWWQVGKQAEQQAVHGQGVCGQAHPPQACSPHGAGAQQGSTCAWMYARTSTLSPGCHVQHAAAPPGPWASRALKAARYRCCVLPQQLGGRS